MSSFLEANAKSVDVIPNLLFPLAASFVPERSRPPIFILHVSEISGLTDLPYGFSLSPRESGDGNVDPGDLLLRKVE